MTQKLTKAERFTLADRPDLAALVADFRAAALVDNGYAERIARAGAGLAQRRGTLPERGSIQK